MSSIDLKKNEKDLYAPGQDPVMVQVPPLRYLMIDGEGDPGSAAAYTDAVQTLYPVAYAIRKAIIDATGSRYTVMPLEGLWWTPDMADFSTDDRDAWHWRMMIRLPEPASALGLDDIVASTAAAKDLPAAALIRHEVYVEGLATQVLHRGPYADEGPTVARLHAFIAEQGHQLGGHHHEIYLSDPRRVAPERLRTILRQPVAT